MTPSSPVALLSRSAEVPPGTAAADVLGTDLAALRACVDTTTAAEVDALLRRPLGGLHASDLPALLSPAAADRLEDLAQLARARTLQRFGRGVRLFAPLYVSNECVSVCTYCGFSAGNEIARRTLTIDEAIAEATELVVRGFRHVLLVAGEHARIVSKAYLLDVVRALAPLVPQLSVEVQVWDEAFYADLVAAGCDGVVVYQETYDATTYDAVHLKGKKRNAAWRLGAPDRAAAAGARRLGIAALLGLHGDWRSEAIALAVHAEALCKRWWKAEVQIALPRLKPAAGGYEPADPVDDRSLVQLLCALRLCLPDVGVSLSTRERAELRDALVPLGITQMSAGSHTEPGGYAEESAAEPQFEISDDRSPAEVAAALVGLGYEPVWKDWQRS